MGKNMTSKKAFSLSITKGYLQSIKMLDFSIKMLNIKANNTSHASRKICAPWGVTFFMGMNYEVS
jgi:prophage tail gpP-like protein